MDYVAVAYRIPTTDDLGSSYSSVEEAMADPFFWSDQELAYLYGRLPSRYSLPTTYVGKLPKISD